MIYTNENRGKFQYEERARQLIEFDGIQYRDCTPTDVDLFLEKNNKAFIFSEIKYKDSLIPRGQMTAYARLVDSLTHDGKDAVLFIGQHEVNDPNKNIVAAETIVTEIYFRGKWLCVDGKITLKEMMDEFLKWSILGIGDFVTMASIPLER